MTNTYVHKDIHFLMEQQTLFIFQWKLFLFMSTEKFKNGLHYSSITHGSVPFLNDILSVQFVYPLRWVKKDLADLIKLLHIAPKLCYKVSSSNDRELITLALIHHFRQIHTHVFFIHATVIIKNRTKCDFGTRRQISCLPLFQPCWNVWQIL